ncbi:DUF2510 domain-containing protein [Sanguibacter hominis ATCC BAA-789]|uniref:DUF2510 domain-containing protein n=1 Tax=Sanguibacter hominis ATCC BAA-789 TaxID=1312740 RepID=A0A9X5FIG0_9MICO|nr:DUF2510 domain-containing protein [Sanguibacter hominis ATCC BAA-789]
MTAPDGGGDVLVGPAGWYRHPEGGERWWDGTAWTESERVDGKVRTVSRPATPQQAAERERERSWNRRRGRIVGWFVAAVVLWVVGAVAFQAAADRFPALERTTPAERVAALLRAPRGVGSAAVEKSGCPTTDAMLADPSSPDVARFREVKGCTRAEGLALERAAVVTPATEDSPTAVYDVTFRGVKDPAHPDSALGGQTVRLTFTVTKAFLGWKVASVEGLPARVAG